jgi:ribosomal protein S6
MRPYELTCLISSKLSEEEAKNLSAKIESLIKDEEGFSSGLRNLIRRKLAIPIKKERQAYLLTLDFHFEPDKLEIFSKSLKSLPEILRFLIEGKKMVKIEPFREKISPKIKKTFAETEKVEIEEIEKKLEEILGEI